MYRAPSPGEQQKRDYRFGDIFEAPWIFDLVLRRDSVPVTLQQVPGKPTQQAFYPQDISTIRKRRDYPKDRVVVHADAEGLAIGHGNGACAVIVSDACDIDEAIREQRGRLKFAALTKLPGEGPERHKALMTLAFDRYPVPPQPEIEFEGGVIEFQQSFSIMAKDLEAATRILTIDDDEVRQDVHFRWSAHTTRHGPVAAADAAAKLAKMMTANGDLERANAMRFDPDAEIDPLDAEIIEPLKELLLLPWLLEGPVVDRIGTDLEHGQPFRPAVDQVLMLLRRIGPASERAIMAIERAAAAHEAGSKP